MNKQNNKECINNILLEITDDMGSASIRIINAIIDDLGDEEKEFVNNTMKKHPRFNPIYQCITNSQLSRENGGRSLKYLKIETILQCCTVIFFNWNQTVCPLVSFL